MYNDVNLGKTAEESGKFAMFAHYVFTHTTVELYEDHTVVRF